MRRRNVSLKDIFMRYVSAYNAKDVSGMLACFDEACVFENFSAGKITVRTESKAELEALARKSAEAFDTREMKVIAVIEGADRLAAEIDYHAVLRADLAPELKAGNQLELRGVSICEFSGDRIVRLSDYS